jgi:hypothetical protein
MMDGSFAHIIQKQVFETSFTSKEEALKNQHGLAEVFQRSLVPVMTDIFDKLIPPDQMYLIDKIDIDLGTISLEKFEENLGEKLETLLEEVVLAKIHEIKNTSVSKSKSTLSTSLKNLSDRGVSVSLQDAKIEAFLFFLQKGHRPWWASNYNPKQGKGSLSELLSESGILLRKHVFDLLSIETVRKRLLNNFPKSDLEALLGIEQIKNFLDKLSLDFERIGKKIGHPLKGKTKIIDSLWTVFFGFVSKQTKITERLFLAKKQRSTSTKQYSVLTNTQLTESEKSSLISEIFEVWIQPLFNQKKDPNLKKEDDPLNLFFRYLEAEPLYSSTELKRYFGNNLSDWKKNWQSGAIFQKPNPALANEKTRLRINHQK